MDARMKALSEKLKDERGKRVVFVSHCILNENTIYLGGAFSRGTADAVVDRLQEQGLGIVQMPCPEQRAWGGVLKRTMWLWLGSKSTLHRLDQILLPLFIWYTRRVYRGIARAVAREIGDYVDSGIEVVGIVGIRGSPSCGVRTTLDLTKSAGYLAGSTIGDLDRQALNERGIRGCWVEGSGLFVDALKAELKKRKIEVKSYEHDHFTELGPA